MKTQTRSSTVKPSEGIGSSPCSTPVANGVRMEIHCLSSLQTLWLRRASTLKGQLIRKTLYGW